MHAQTRPTLRLPGGPRSVGHSRRRFLQALLAASGGLAGGPALTLARSPLADEQRRAWAADDDRALIAITLDLEMSRNFPAWEDTHWDYEKGNLNAETKAYAARACRLVESYGGVLHMFCVGRVCEQESVAWLQELVAAGHPLGNHTYDHVYVLAQTLEEIQFRFRRAPWLIAGREPLEVIAENIRLCTAALESRLGVQPAGFRTPGGFATGLDGAEAVQQVLLELGFSWVSSKYPAHAMPPSGTRPDEAAFQAIVDAQQAAQPYVYPSGLVEVPMSPVSDVNAFRSCRWPLEDFVAAIERSVRHCIEHRLVFDFLAHPSCLYVTDPEVRAIERICQLVAEAGEHAVVCDLETIAMRAARKAAG